MFIFDKQMYSLLLTSLHLQGGLVRMLALVAACSLAYMLWSWQPRVPARLGFPQSGHQEDISG